MSTPTTISNSTYMASVYQTLLVFGFFSITLAQNATNVINEVSGLTPPAGYSFGRYFAQPGNPSIPFSFATDSVETMVAQGVVLRAALATALDALLADAQGQYSTGAPVIPIPQIIACVSALAACYANPLDQINGMMLLAQFQAPSYINPATVGLDQIGCQILQLCNRTATRVRIAALLQLATAISQYVPVSQSDAATVRSQASYLFDVEMYVQANYFDNASYQSLKAANGDGGRYESAGVNPATRHHADIRQKLSVTRSCLSTLSVGGT